MEENTQADIESKLDCTTIVPKKPDKYGRIVTIVYYSDKSYSIYDIEQSDKLYHVTEGAKRDASEISIEIERLYQIADRERIKLEKHRLAKAYKECFEGNIEVAKGILKSLEKSLFMERVLHLKYTYVITGGIFAFVNCLLSIYILNFNMILTNTVYDLFFVATFGSLGGLVSISISVRKFNFIKLKFIKLENKKFVIADACLRIFISMISGIAIYYIIVSNVLLGFINQLENNKSQLIFLFSIISGFSESFIPNLLSSIEKKTGRVKG